MLYTFPSCIVKRPQSITITRIRHYAKPAKSPPTKRVSSTMKKEQKTEERVKYNKSLGPSIMFHPLPRAALQGPLFKEVINAELSSFLPKDISFLSVNKPMTFQNELMFKAYGIPREIVLEFRLLPRPCSILRDSTLESTDILKQAGQGSSENSRVVFNGPRGCGKSFLLMQTVDYALSSNWIVLYIPRAISLLNSSTSYRYDIRTRTYHQPYYSQQLLRRFLSVNGQGLQSIKINRPFELDRLNVFPEGSGITRLIQAGLKDANLAPDILAAVLDQLAGQTTHPVLLAIDDFQALYCTSEYRNPDFELLESHHLSIPRLLLEYAGGLKSFNRGAVIGAISSTNTRYGLPLVLSEALNASEDRFVTPYNYRSPALQTYSAGLRHFKLPSRLNISEAAALFELWEKILALHSRPTDEFFLSKYTEASGNARELVWNGFLGTLESS